MLKTLMIPLAEFFIVVCGIVYSCALVDRSTDANLSRFTQIHDLADVEIAAMWDIYCEQADASALNDELDRLLLEVLTQEP